MKNSSLTAAGFNCIGLSQFTNHCEIGSMHLLASILQCDSRVCPIVAGFEFLEWMQKSICRG